MVIGFIGWQEIIALGVVGLAVWLLVRRAVRGQSETGACGRCAETRQSADRSIKITELRQVRIEGQPPESADTEDA